MSIKGQVDIKHIQKEYFNENVLLRKPEEENINAYAEAMLQGAKFPPIILGTFPPTNANPTGKAIVDGTTRFMAALKAKLDKFPVEHKEYDNEYNMKLDMWKLNAAQGARIPEKDRNKRIIELKNAGLPQNLLAKTFLLSEGTISRIVSGKIQGTKPGGVKKKKGTQETEADIKEYGATAFFNALKRIRKTLHISMPDIEAECLPVDEQGTQTENKPRLTLVFAVQSSINRLANDLEKQLKDLNEK